MSGSVSTNHSDLSYAVPTGLAAVMLAGVVTVLWRMTSAPAPMPPMQAAIAPEASPAPVAQVQPARPAHPAYRIAATARPAQIAPKPAPKPVIVARIVPPLTPAVSAAPATPAAAPVQPAAARMPATETGATPQPAAIPVPKAAPKPTPAPARLARLAAQRIVVQRIVVRPGETLWRIAQAQYGNGAFYKAIFHANRGQLVSASLIRVGQVLVLPVLSAQGTPIPPHTATLGGGSGASAHPFSQAGPT